MRGKVNYDYKLMVYKRGQENADQYDISIPQKFLVDMKTAIGLDGSIICAGFYSNKSTSYIDGSYYLRINPKTKEVLSRSFKEFDIDFITQYMKKRKEKKAKRKEAKGKEVELPEYEFRDIILRDDGGAILIGEQYYITVVITTSQGPNGGMNTQTTTYYHYNDIIVINIDPDGQIQWNQKIAKRQSSTSGYYLSYAMAVANNQIHFIFNDNIKNIQVDNNRKIHDFGGYGKSAIVSIVSMDINGNQERKILFHTKKENIITAPRLCEQVAEDKMIIYGVKRKKNKFALVTFTK